MASSCESYHITLNYCKILNGNFKYVIPQQICPAEDDQPRQLRDTILLASVLYLPRTHFLLPQYVRPSHAKHRRGPGAPNELYVQCGCQNPFLVVWVPVLPCKPASTQMESNELACFARIRAYLSHNLQKDKVIEATTCYYILVRITIKRAI